MLFSVTKPKMPVLVASLDEITDSIRYCFFFVIAHSKAFRKNKTPVDEKNSNKT